MPNPKVSIIVPVFNTGCYLDDMLTSLESQSFSDIEIICVDDGSTDDSAQIIKNHAEKDSRVQYLFQENQGGGVARNLGISKASGKYIICLDSDDIYEKNLIEKLYEKAQKTDADIVICMYNQIDMQTSKISHGKGLNLKKLPQKEVFSRKDTENIFSVTNPGPCNKFYKTEFIKSNNLKYSSLKTTNDLSFTTIALALAQKISTVKEELSTVRYMSAVSGTTQRQKSTHNSIVAYQEIYNAFAKRNIFEEMKTQFFETVSGAIVYNLTFPTNEKFIENLKIYFSKEPFNSLSKDELKKVLKINRFQREYFEYTFLFFLTLGLNKNLKKKRNGMKNLFKNLKLLGI